MHIKQFKLPDLGEGLTEATIHKWHVQPNDHVTKDQTLVTVETAKALVDLPSPFTGTILKIYGTEQSIIKVDNILLEYTNLANATAETSSTIIGALPEKSWHWGVVRKPKANTIDIYKQSCLPKPKYEESLHGIRKSMAQTMHNVNREVVLTTIMNDAILNASSIDISIALIKAIIYACSKEPNLNAWFDYASLSRTIHKDINLGIACDTPNGLFVPVLPLVDPHSQDLRASLNQIKHQIHTGCLQNSTIKPTFTLSNIGSIGGKYATPIIIPPQVAILAAGKLYSSYTMHQNQLQPVWLLPLSLSFDHRVVTGGEAARFLQAILNFLL